MSIAPATADTRQASATSTDDLDDQTLRRVFGAFPSGVVVLGAQTEDGPQALVASSFTVGVSLHPPLVSVAVQRSSQTWPRIRTAPAIGVSYAGEVHAGVLRQLAGRDRAHRFDGVGTIVTPHDALLLAGSPVHLETVLHAEIAAGDHTVALLEVRHVHEEPEHRPLLWHASGVRTLD